MDPCYSWTFIESFWFVLPSAVVMQDSKMITKSWADKIVMAWLVKQSNRTQSEPLNTQTSYTLRKEGCSCSKNLPAVITIKYAPMLQILPGVSENPPLVSKHVRTNIFGNA